MSNGMNLQFRLGAVSDIANPPSVEQFAEAMVSSRYNRPRPMELELLQYRDFGADVEGDLVVTILVVPTALRTTFVEGHDWPDFEFEGWVLGQPGKPWVRGALKYNERHDIRECTIYVLEPGQEMGTERTPGAARHKTASDAEPYRGNNY
jgi:hypothetical protein